MSTYFRTRQSSAKRLLASINTPPETFKAHLHKRDIIEISYGLLHSNHIEFEDQTDEEENLKTLCNRITQSLNIPEIKNIPIQLCQIRKRKKTKTPFLNILKKSFLKNINKKIKKH